MLTAKNLLASLLVTGITAGFGLMPTTTAPADETPQVGPDGLTLARADLRVGIEGDLSLAALLDAYSSATGVRLLMSPPVRDRVEATTFAGFGESLALSPDELQGFVEGLLARSDFRLAMTLAGSAPVVSLLDVHAPLVTDSPWWQVPVDHISHFADNPALLVQTIVPCRETDARAVSNSMRALVNHPWSHVVGLGSEKSIFLRGTGTEVARLVESVHRADRNEAKADDVAAALARPESPESPERPERPERPDDGAIAKPEEVRGPAERPTLVTHVFSIDRDFTRVADVLKDLTYNRHAAERQADVWYRGDAGDLVFWPRPHFSYMRGGSRHDESSGGQLVVQAAAEDVAWIEEALDMVSGLDPAPE